MGSLLSPAKVVLLAVKFASHADIESLHHLAARYNDVLGSELLLRILLTYLPETTTPSAYVDLVQQIGEDDVRSDDHSGLVLDTTTVEDLTEDQAIRKTRKLRLLDLSDSGEPSEETDDIVTRFLFRRAYKMDEEAGMLNYLAELLMPFAGRPAIRTWMASTVLPLARRNLEYYVEDAPCPLATFQKLPDRAAVQYLLSQTGISEDKYDCISRDLRGILSPWVYDSARWVIKDEFPDQLSEKSGPPKMECAGWEQALEWLVLQASKAWEVAVQAVDHWGGPRDVQFIGDIVLELGESQLQYLDLTFTRAVLASAYSIPEPTLDALDGAYRIMCKARCRLGLADTPLIEVAAENLPEIPCFDVGDTGGARFSAATFLRNDLLHASNLLTYPTESTTDFLTAIILSAYVLTHMGIPCSVRRAGELALLQDEREQRSELVKLLRLASNHPKRNSDDYWARIRRDILWLHNWGVSFIGDRSDSRGRGVLGTISTHDIEVELLKAMLSQARYSLVKSLYQDPSDMPLPAESARDAVYQAALDAFDNASNPNRTKGGLRKCNDIIHALPKLVPASLATTKQIESLLAAAHSLSGYRLVLKQGEPFSPVVLRVHSDPVSIIDKVLEQNNDAYTRLQEFLEIGINMVVAGFLTRNKLGKSPSTPEEQDVAMEEAEKRIVASCIYSALREDDFETAYSYVVSRLGSSDQEADNWSWKAALKAGEYVRTSKTQQPTHLGTSSGNPEVRHLEQRLDCLATALRVAPAAQLQTVLESFRHCEEHLDSAITEEAAKEAAWDTAGDVRGLPGSYDAPAPDNIYPPRNITASGTARQVEETPMSLFDLSRATARVAQRNLTSLSSLHGLAHGGEQSEASAAEDAGQQRARKRDQLREAATGTLVSGVGWLIGANVSRDGPNSS